MVKQRLSRLQKWILGKCLKDLELRGDEVKEFFGKKYTNRKPEIYGERYDFKARFGESYEQELNIEKVQHKTDFGTDWHGFRVSAKKEFCITNSEKAIISRTLKRLKEKGFLIQPEKWRRYQLTKAGFLKANKIARGDTFVSFNEYQKKIRKIEANREAEIAAITAVFAKMKPGHLGGVKA